MQVKSDLMHVVERNREKFNAAEAYESILAGKRYAHYDAMFKISMYFCMKETESIAKSSVF